MWIMLQTGDKEWAVGFFRMVRTQRSGESTQQFEAQYSELPKAEAARLVNYLNGGAGTPLPPAPFQYGPFIGDLNNE